MLAIKNEKYEFTWHGKTQAGQIALTPSMGTLRPSRKDSVDFDTTKNLFIEGDNLEVLKLLQKSYANKIKMIYIDPPYNTGHNFVYKDKFQDSLSNYLKYTGQKDGDGAKTTSNPESSGRYHTNWLNMMYPRLKLARNLLRQDGVIFISIDDREVANLRKICDEIFGEENFITNLVWAAGRKNDSQFISVSHEYMACYVKNKEYLKENNIIWRERKKGIDEINKQYQKLKAKYKNNYELMTQKMKEWYRELPEKDDAKKHKHYCNIDEQGIYFLDNISWPGGGGPRYKVLHPTTGKPVKIPSRGWAFSDPKKMDVLIKKNLIHFGKNENLVPCIKRYLKEHLFQVPYSVFYQDMRAAAKRLRELIGDVFTFPKDETIIKNLISIISYNSSLTENMIILDFFAGSCTTAHAVFDLNKEDGGSRKFIMVQLPEKCDKKSEAYKAGYKTIADIGMERIRRAAKKIKKEDSKYKGDLGFKVFKLDKYGEPIT